MYNLESAKNSYYGREVEKLNKAFNEIKNKTPEVIKNFKECKKLIEENLEKTYSDPEVIKNFRKFEETRRKNLQKNGLSHLI